MSKHNTLEEIKKVFYQRFPDGFNSTPGHSLVDGVWSFFESKLKEEYKRGLRDSDTKRDNEWKKAMKITHEQTGLEHDN